MAEVTRQLIDPDKILKEVHDTKNIEAKTELTTVQVESVNKLKTLADLFGSDFLNHHVNDFLILQKSKDRKSMTEFVESLRSKKEDIMKDSKTFTLMG